MKNGRRTYKLGQYYFLTHVTHNRTPVLVKNFDLFRRALVASQQRDDYEMVAWVVLPDHWHCIMRPKSTDPGAIVKRIKLSFAQQFLKRQGQNKGRVWQNRFWDHILRNQEDYRRHMDYIHYNPCKHGLASRPYDYPFSSFRRLVRLGIYEKDWGDDSPAAMEGNYGE